LLKTLQYISDDSHLAKCAFGNLRRVEVKDAKLDVDGKYQDSDNQDFIQMYTEIFSELEN
jgi:hypothetical protein